MRRRAFIKLGGAAALGLRGAKAFAGQQMQEMQGTPPKPSPAEASYQAAPLAGKADITLRIAPVPVELAPTRIISTIGYNGTSPGPVLRMREGKPVTVDVINDTDTPEFVHWHGFLIPPEVDGTPEEETPPVPPRGRRRFQFTPGPAGTRWYHSHAMAMEDLHKGTYTGQFGFVMVDSGQDPGHYDQELFLALRDWEPFFTSQLMDDDDAAQACPQPERPAVLDTRPNGLEVGSAMY
ncbi:MAG: multicopper oxidase domain-containing protein, partial [Bryobacteraceae bacterium]